MPNADGLHKVQYEQKHKLPRVRTLKRARSDTPELSIHRNAMFVDVLGLSFLLLPKKNL